MIHHVLVAAVLTGSPAPLVESHESLDALAVSLADDVQTGTLLFSRGDCLAVKVFTQSPYTHVAAVVVEDRQAYVYDSTNGVGVRRLPLHAYLAAQTPDTLHVCQPVRPFGDDRAARFHAFLRSQLGRPYAIRHHLTGQRSEGVHCAEYAIDALMAAELMRAKQPPRVSPASLREGVLTSGVYIETKTLALDIPDDAPEGANWCHQLWLDTKSCTYDSCVQLRRWFLCW